MSSLDIQFAKSEKSDANGFTSYYVTFDGFSIDIIHQPGAFQQRAQIVTFNDASNDFSLNIIDQPGGSQKNTEVIRDQEGTRKSSFKVKDKGNSKYELTSDGLWAQIVNYHVEVVGNKTIVKHAYRRTAYFESTYTITETKESIECTIVLTGNGQPVQSSILGHGRLNSDAVCRGAILTGLFTKMLDHKKESADWDFVEEEPEEWDEITKEVDLDDWME